MELCLVDWATDALTKAFEFTEAELASQKHVKLPEDVLNCAFKEHAHLISTICGGDCDTLKIFSL